MSQRSNSGGSDESLAERSVATSVIRDTGTKVQLLFKAHGLKKRKSLLNSIVTAFRKVMAMRDIWRIIELLFMNRIISDEHAYEERLPSSPSRLLSNGKFTKFELKPHSIHFILEVQTEKKKKKGNANRVDRFVCEIKQFPTAINPDSAEFEVLEPASGECFILLSLIKVDNLKVNWKEFLESNGTLDVTCI